MDSAAVLQFVGGGGGLVALIGVLIYAWREIRAGRQAAKQSDLDSLKGVVGVQDKAMKAQAARYDKELATASARCNARIDRLEEQLELAKSRTDTAERVTVACRHRLIEHEEAMRAGGLIIPEWRDPP